MKAGDQRAADPHRLTRRIRARVWRVQMMVVIVASALTVPLLAAALWTAWRAPATTFTADLDIPGALIRPAGLLALACTAFLWLTIELLGHAAQLGIAHGALYGRALSLPQAFGLVGRHFRGLLVLITRFALQSLGIALPFLLLAFGVVSLQLDQRGLAPSLIERPPEFLLALTLAALLLIGMGLAQIRHLINWMLALPLLLFHGESPAEARLHSRNLATGHRARLFFHLLGWLAIPPAVALGTALAAIPPLIRASTWFDARIELTSLVACLALAAWLLVGLLARFISASCFCTYHARLCRRAGLDAGSDDLPPPAPEWAPGVLGTVAAALLLATLGTTHSWLGRLLPDPDVAVIAHRGASTVAPENTLAAIEAAITAGADQVEIDVQFHPEGALLVFHDNDLERIAGRPEMLRDLSLDEIAGIDAGGWFSRRFKGEPVPTLSDALAACRGRCGVMIDLKSTAARQPFAEAVVAAVAAAGTSDSVMLASFDSELIQRLKRMRPAWRVGLLARSDPRGFETLPVDFLAVAPGALSRGLTRRAHRSGIEVHAWTLNRAIDISAAVSRGADGVITDRPQAARRVLENRSGIHPAERLILDLLSRAALIQDLLRK